MLQTNLTHGPPCHYE